MDKKKRALIMGIFAGVTVLGIVLIAMSATPYRNCSRWITSTDYIDGYLYAHRNIGRYAAMFYGGILLTAAGPLGILLTPIITKLKEQEAAKQQPPISNFD